MMTMLHTWVSNNEFGALLRLDTRFLQCWEKSCHKWNTQILVFHSIKDAMVFSKISKKRVQKLLKLLPNMQSGKNTVNGCSRESLWSANFAFSHDYDIFFISFLLHLGLKCFGNENSKLPFVNILALRLEEVFELFYDVLWYMLASRSICQLKLPKLITRVLRGHIFTNEIKTWASSSNTNINITQCLLLMIFLPFP